MRPVWNGGISFGLIFIPVNLYTAVESVQIDLDLLSKKDLNPIRYARIDKVTGKEVAWKDVVKGYQIRKGDYVVLDEADFDKIALHRSNTIEITSFVDKEQIDPVYYEKPYYLEPDKGADKTYQILLEALHKSNKVGIAEFIFKNREHVCSISAEGDILQLNQMRYQSELRSPEDLKLPHKVKIKPKEMDLAIQLIDAMTEEFDPNDYSDDYLEAFHKLVKAKKAKKTISVPDTTPAATDVSQIIKELEASLQEYAVNK